jgi:hypothetical protein
MLAGIYNWFSEGFDTADLKEAMVLLGELSCQVFWQPTGNRKRSHLKPVAWIPR